MRWFSALFVATAALSLATASATPDSPGPAIPEDFHGIWVQEVTDCRDERQVRTNVGGGGYSREEIDARPTDVQILRQRPLRARINFIVRAEGLTWSAVEEWSASSSGDSLTMYEAAHGERSGGETTYFRCEPPQFRETTPE